jgi:hypothetical protein
MAVGLILGQHLDPAASPVLTHRGWLLLDNDGCFVSVEGSAIESSPEHVECCASGRCEVCTPGYVWGRDG